MPQIGEIRKASELGYKAPKGHSAPPKIWHACIDCGKERWVSLREGKPVSNRCLSCSKKGGLNQRWNGGRILDSHDYIAIKLQANDFFYPMVDHQGYVEEHRLIMARHLGRCLWSWEFIHHKNGNKHDNKLENLELTTRSDHAKRHNLGQIKSVIMEITRA